MKFIARESWNWFLLKYRAWTRWQLCIAICTTHPILVLRFQVLYKDSCRNFSVVIFICKYVYSLECIVSSSEHFIVIKTAAQRDQYSL